MTLLGATPKKRNIEQHDIFFGIANNLKELVPQFHEFWSEAEGNIHIDAWREVNFCDDYKIEIVSKNENLPQKEKLFFINLGGYLKGDFEEHHYKTLLVAQSKSEAIKKVKQTPFFKDYDFKGAASHIDDQYGLDVDDIFEIEDILDKKYKDLYKIKISESNTKMNDELNIGYLKLSKI